MKSATIWLMSLAFVLALFPAVRLMQGVTVTETAVAADKALPTGTLTADNKVIYTKRTCSGALASERPNLFVYGLTNTETGKCMTRRYLANNDEEALGCARKTCPDCRIEDLTWLYGFSSSAPGISDSDNYCPAQK